ncbi:hypothetical protein SEA_FRANKIE_26 [Mycobacterium phage Frankie]|nr:hypothetical protein SEA_FRANKIE_26 [Mycobacterium phage Frankie]
MEYFEEIRKLRAERAGIVGKVEALDARIAELIREASAAGHKPTEIAREIGISRGRVYQILGAR